MKVMIRVIVIDENDNYREDFCRILQKACYDVVLSAKRTLHSEKNISKIHADLAIVDFHDADPQSLNIAVKIRELYPEIKLIFHSLHSPMVKISQIYKIGNGLIVKIHYDVQKGFHLIDQVLNNSIAVFSDKIVIQRKTFWILGRPHPDFPYMLSEIAIEKVKRSPVAIANLMNVFSRNQLVIESWLEHNDARLLAPKSLQSISENCKLNISDIMVESNAGIFQVMV